MPLGGLERLCGRLERCRRLLVVAEAGHAAVQQACVRRWLAGDALGAPADPDLSAFLQARPQLCLLLGARCAAPLAASAVTGAWRSCWIAELGAQPSELAVLAREQHRGPALELLEELWKRFLGGDAGAALRL